ncbi:MAG: hypothetical protein RPU42_14540 [Candidatus Sedimenticola sp. (ex Thyasira tokunagai)]
MSPGSKLETNLSASLQLKPELSQISIIVLLIISGLSFLTSFYFSWHEKSWWLPAITGIVCLIFSGVAWWRSQRAIDLGNSFPTEVSGNNGLRVTTDTRAIESNNAINNLAKIIETVSVRQPLPPADGVLSEKGEILRNSENNGKKATEKINELIKKKEIELGQSCINIQRENAEEVIVPPVEANILEHSGVADKGGA